MSSEKRNLARGGALSFLGSGLSAVLGFVLTVFLARSLGDAGVGVVMQAMSVFSIALALSKFGMDSTAIWIMPRLVISQGRSIPGVLTQMICIVLAVSVAALAILQVATPRVWAGSPEVVDAIRAVAWFLPAGAVMLLLVAALRALGNVRTYVLLGNIALPTLRLPAAIVAVWLGASLTIISLVWAAPVVLVLVIAAIVLLRYLTPHRLGERPPRDWGRLTQILRFALPRTASAGMEQAIIWLGVLLVGVLAGSAAAGVYGGASRFVQAGLIIDSAIRVVVSPRFSAMLHIRDKAGVQDLYATAAVWLVLFATPLYLVLAFFAPTALSILGPEFGPGASSLIVLCAGAIVTFLAGNIHSVLLMSGRSGWAALNKLVVLAITVVGSIILIPRIGFLGAAITWAVSMAVDAALAVVQVRKFVGITPQPKQVLLPLGVALGTVGTASALAAALIGTNVTGLVVALVMGGSAFLVACYFLRGKLHLDGLRSALPGRS